MEVQDAGKVGGHGGKEVMVANRRRMRGWDFLLRFLALGLTLVAAVLVGVDKQTKIVPFTLVPTLPPVNIPVTAKWHHMSAFVYFVVANAIACSYAAISLVLTLAGKEGLSVAIIIFDLVMVALLYSSGGAALAVGLLGYEGNSHVQWKKVCGVFGKFCNQAAIGISLSILGAVLFFLLVALAALHRRKKN
ncbi:CASP-like protein 1E2 [Olea europaea var. sylvestris]|nr:CASP-like protein 1E2 [Olea europaea var. sylvestris]CAA2983157.1 CASP 1E2 [Olea europaea subsp. europaea]